jgi:hypothetical protein
MGGAKMSLLADRYLWMVVVECKRPPCAFAHMLPFRRIVTKMTPCPGHPIAALAQPGIVSAAQAQAEGALRRLSGDAKSISIVDARDKWY